MFRDFRKVWEEGNLYQRKHLLEQVREKVWVKGNEITAMTLRPSYHLVVSGLKQAVDETGEKEKTIQKDNDLSRWLSGSDGRRIGMWHTFVTFPTGSSLAVASVFIRNMHHYTTKLGPPKSSQRQLTLR